MIIVFHCEQHWYTTHGEADLCSLCVHISWLIIGFGSDEQVISTLYTYIDCPLIKISKMCTLIRHPNTVLYMVSQEAQNRR